MIVAALLSLWGSSKTAVLGLGVAIYAVLSEDPGQKLAPWAGVFVSAAFLASGMMNLKMQERNAGVTKQQEQGGHAEEVVAEELKKGK